jgi:hypothetical protein
VRTYTLKNGKLVPTIVVQRIPGDRWGVILGAPGSSRPRDLVPLAETAPEITDGRIAAAALDRRTSGRNTRWYLSAANTGDADGRALVYVTNTVQRISGERRPIIRGQRAALVVLGAGDTVQTADGYQLTLGPDGAPVAVQLAAEPELPPAADVTAAMPRRSEAGQHTGVNPSDLVQLVVQALRDLADTDPDRRVTWDTYVDLVLETADEMRAALAAQAEEDAQAGPGQASGESSATAAVAAPMPDPVAVAMPVVEVDPAAVTELTVPFAQTAEGRLVTLLEEAAVGESSAYLAWILHRAEVRIELLRDSLAADLEQAGVSWSWDGLVGALAAGGNVYGGSRKRLIALGLWDRAEMLVTLAQARRRAEPELAEVERREWKLISGDTGFHSRRDDATRKGTFVRYDRSALEAMLEQPCPPSASLAAIWGQAQSELAGIGDLQVWDAMERAGEGWLAVPASVAEALTGGEVGHE